MFEAAPYRPPLDPDVVLQKVYTVCGALLAILYILCLLGVLVWGVLAIRYLVHPFPETPINPVRHDRASFAFIFFMIFSGFFFYVIIPILFRSYWVLPCIWCLFVVGYVIVAAVAISSDAFKCQSSSHFPVSVKMTAGRPAYGDVYFHKEKLWRLRQDVVDRTYHTRIDSPYLIWSPSTGTWVPQPSDGQWPRNTIVDGIWMTLNPMSLGQSSDADGVLNGTCRGRLCLTGKIWTYPRLAFEWKYTNPESGENKTKRMSSEEAEWYFGYNNRPLASLQQDGNEIFRAQSSTTVCGGGDGDIETSLVPVGLMLMAENRYKLNIKNPLDF